MKRVPGKKRDWEPAEQLFLQLVKEHPILYNFEKKNKNSRKNFFPAPDIWKAVSEEMCKRGYPIKPKSCRDKFTRIWKNFKKVYEISKVDPSLLCSKYLDGTLSFLEKEIETEIRNNDDIDCLQDQARHEKSSDSVTGFSTLGFPSISLLSSGSEYESTVSSTNIPLKESRKIVFEPTETTNITTKTIVSIEMIEALLKSKIDSSSANTVGSTFHDDASNTVANLNRTLPTSKDQTNVNKAAVAGENNFAFIHCAGPANSVIMSTNTITSTQINTMNCTDISEVEININTAAKNFDFSNASTDDIVKKEITSIFDINSAEGDIEVFLNEVADFMSNTYSFERQMEIRLKISDLVAAAKNEKTDQPCNSSSTNIIINENLALEQLAGIKHTLPSQSHVYDVYDLGSDSDSSL